MAFWNRDSKQGAGKGGASAVGSGEKPPASAVLLDACAARIPVVISVLDSPEVYLGRMMSVSRDGLKIVLDPRSSIAGFVPLSGVGVMFRRKKIPHSMVTAVLRFSATPRMELTLRVPKEIARSPEEASIYQVPMHPSVEVEATITHEERELKCKLSRVSRSGMQVEFADKGFECDVGTSFQTELTMGEVTAKLFATVVRRKGKKYDLFFDAALKKGKLKSPKELVAICDEAERVWLEERAKHMG